MHPLDKLMKCAVRIEAKLSTGGIATGSGFAYRFAEQENGPYILAIVTNKHVIKDAVSVSIPISITDHTGNLTRKYEKVPYEINNTNVIDHPDREVDLCAILTEPIHEYFQKKGKLLNLSYLDKSIVADIETFSNLLPLEEVMMVGFPNGIWDFANNGAIARRGVIATMPSDDYQGKKQFVVDMACFPGSSGSPVFLANLNGYSDRNENIIVDMRIKLLGVLYAGPQHTASGDVITAPVPTQNQLVTKTLIPNNLGYVIKITELDEIEKLAVKLLGC